VGSLLKVKGVKKISSVHFKSVREYNTNMNKILRVANAPSTTRTLVHFTITLR